MPGTHQRKYFKMYHNSEPGNENFVAATTPLKQPNVLPGRLQDRYFFTNFCRYLAPKLGGSFDSDFWTIQLPRVAFSELAVYHAMIAIAVLDQDNMVESEALHSEQQVLFLLHYNKAIHFVKHQFDKDENSQHVILITCLLFICLEFKRGNVDVALSHLQSGLGILRSQNFNQEPSELLDVGESLAHAFSRLSIQALLAGHSPSLDLYHTFKVSHLEHNSFSDIGEARNSLISLFIESLKHIGKDYNYEASFSMSVSEQSRRARLISQLHDWNSQLGLFMMNTLNSPTSQDSRMFRLLRIQSLVAIIWNSTTIPPSEGSSIELSFDAYTSMFSTIISLAAFLIHDPATPNSNTDPTPLSTYSTTLTSSSTCHLPASLRKTTSNSQPTFSIEMELIFSLYFVAIKCRSPTLRRRAINFLSQVDPRREGVWDAHILGKVSQYVIETEEIDCTEPVTEEVMTWPGVECRVHAIYIFPVCDYVKRVQKVQCFGGPGSKLGSEWVVDIVF
jgi:hypothetical protein